MNRQTIIAELADRVVGDTASLVVNGSPAELESYASLVAALTGAPHAGEIIVPADHVLRACERAADVRGFFVAAAVERLGPPAFRDRAGSVVRALTGAAGDHADRLGAVGSAAPVRALVLTEPHHNGHLLVLESERPDGSRVTVQTTIETALRGAAVEFAHDVDAAMVFGAAEDEPSLIAEELTPADARAWLDVALAMRDEHFQIDPADDDDLASEQALSIVRHLFAQCPDDGMLPDRARFPTDDEITQLRVDFLGSEAFAQLGADTEVDLHLDHIVDFGRGVSGRPLWWSPITVQLFASFIEHIVATDERSEHVAALRPILTAWVIWAGDTLDKDEMTIQETVLAVEQLFG